MKRIILGCLFLFTSIMVFGKADLPSEKSRQIDIHLIPSSNIKDQIKAFNSNLEKKGLLKKFNTVPFLVNHPVHLTLYLTSFPTSQLSKIDKMIKNIADNVKKFPVKTSYIEASPSNYVMLEVTMNKELQKLSNQVVSKLAIFRNKSYEIPVWAKNNPKRVKIFDKTGSPTAYSEFKGHFSILELNPANEKMEKEYLTDFNKAIKEFSYKPTETEMIAISYGYVNEYGQITETLGTYPLK